MEASLLDMAPVQAGKSLAEAAEAERVAVAAIRIVASDILVGRWVDGRIAGCADSEMGGLADGQRVEIFMDS